MRKINLYAQEPIKYIAQGPGQEGEVLIIDTAWVPDPNVEYVTQITLSEDSSDAEAVTEIMTICDIHCNGKIVAVSGNYPKLVATISSIYNVAIKETTT